MDLLKFPSITDPTIPAYKDWLHLNVFNFEQKVVGLVNLSLHGSPLSRASRAMGTVLMHVPGVGWVGNTEIRGMNEANVTSDGIGLSHVALTSNPYTDTIQAKANLPDDFLSLTLEGSPVTPASEMDFKVPFGSGWISWYLIPRMSIDGNLVFDGAQMNLQGSYGYRDHNWGRWYWGDDIGWEWGVFMSSDPGFTFLLYRFTNQLHTRQLNCQLLTQHHSSKKTFFENEIGIRYKGTLKKRLRRIPGPLAALHQDRICPSLPETISISCEDRQNQLDLAFRGGPAAQIIASDPMRPGYSFIQEIAGEFSARGTIDHADIDTTGLAIVEYVN